MQTSSSMKIYALLLAALCAVHSVESKSFLRALGVPSDGNHRKTRDLSSPSIPVTQKPPCPSYISCPYPSYPRPTTKGPSETELISSEPSTQISSSTESVVTSASTEKVATSTSSLANGGLADRFGSSSESPSQEPSISTEVYPNNDKPSGLGNANGPSISATQKPTCPGYITCPYPSYPRPTTKSPNTHDASTSKPVNPNKEIVNRVQTEESQPSATSIEPVTNKNKTDDLGNVPDAKPTGPGNANGPSISATQKPPCPSYIQCPYPPYPRPTTKSPETSAIFPSTTTSPTKDTTNHADEMKRTEAPSTSEETEIIKNEASESGNTAGPSISATQKPPCPSYINCPYPPYPKPTTEPPASTVPEQDSAPSEKVTERSADDSSPSNLPTEPIEHEEGTSVKPQEIQNKIESPSSTNSPSENQETTTDSLTADEQNEENSFESEPSSDSEGKPTETENSVSSQIPSSTELPSAINPSSHSPQDWNFPGPSSNGQTPSPIIPVGVSGTPAQEVVEYSNDQDYQGPSQSATRKPQCPFYISCPFVYPKPTTSPPSVNQVHAYASSSVNVESLNRIKPAVFAPNHPKFASTNIENVGTDTLESSSIDPVELGNQGAYLPIYSYVYGFDAYQPNSYYNSYYNKRPSVLLTPRPFWPSYLQNPWIYPKPFGDYVNDPNVPINRNEDEISEEERYLPETDYNIY